LKSTFTRDSGRVSGNIFYLHCFGGFRPLEPIYVHVRTSRKLTAKVRVAGTSETGGQALMQTSGACLLRVAKPASPQCRRFGLGGQAGMRREPTNPMHSGSYELPKCLELPADTQTPPLLCEECFAPPQHKVIRPSLLQLRYIVHCTNFHPLINPAHTGTRSEARVLRCSLLVCCADECCAALC